MTETSSMVVVMSKSDSRYPIGDFQRPSELSDRERDEMISEIAALPVRLQEALAGLDEDMVQTPYREGGWTLLQVAHHLADSHINSLCRFKLALTEERPVIRPYLEDEWVSLADARDSADAAVKLLVGVHRKWVAILQSMSSEDFSRTLVHPDTGVWTLDQMLALYAWHGRHHLAHITEARRIRGW